MNRWAGAVGEDMSGHGSGPAAHGHHEHSPSAPPDPRIQRENDMNAASIRYGNRRAGQRAARTTQHAVPVRRAPVYGHKEADANNRSGAGILAGLA